MRRLFVGIVGLVLMGCAGEAGMSGGGNEAAVTIARDDALGLVYDYLGAHPELARWAEGDPFYVGDWDGYVATCESEGVVHSGGMSGWDTAGVTVVVFRKPFLPMGGGREDFFAIDIDGRVYHVRGLVGR